MSDDEEPEYKPSTYVPKSSPAAAESKDFERKAPVVMTSWREQQNSLRRMNGMDSDSDRARIGRNPSSNMLASRDRIAPTRGVSRGISRSDSRQVPTRGVSRASSRQVPSRGVSRGVSRGISRSTSRRPPAREVSRTSSLMAGGAPSEIEEGDLRAMAAALHRESSGRFDLGSLQESQLVQES